jgi:NitT/TauT family transport system substrate-binding protein
VGSAVKCGWGMLSVGLVATLTVGCGAGNNGHGAPLELTKLTVAAVPVGDDAGVYIAKEDGLFKAAGLNVTIDPIVSSAVATAGQNSGKYDITAGNSVSYIQDQVMGHSNLEIVAEGSLMQPGNQALYTLPGSHITKIADLTGKRIGVNVLDNIGTLLISSILRSHGIQPNEVHFVPIAQGFPAMAQELQQHAIDVAWLPEPFGSLDQMNYGFQQLTDLDQGVTADFPVAWYVATKTWAKRYPRTLAAFLGALRQAQQIADNNRSAVEAAMEKLPSPYAIPPMVASIMSVESYPLNIAPNIDLASVQQVADAMYELGMLTSPFKVSTMLTP